MEKRLLLARAGRVKSRKGPIMAAALLALILLAGIGCSDKANPTIQTTPISDEETPSSTFETADPAESPLPPSEIVWIRNWEDARRTAEEAAKPIMVNFYTDICPACRKLDQYTFTDAEVISYVSKHFIPVKSNAGKSSLYQEYGVRGVPSTIFTRPDGTEIGRIIGYYPAGTFLEGAQEAWKLWNDGQG